MRMIFNRRRFTCSVFLPRACVRLPVPCLTNHQPRRLAINIENWNNKIRDLNRFSIIIVHFVTVAAWVRAPTRHSHNNNSNNKCNVDSSWRCVSEIAWGACVRVYVSVRYYYYYYLFLPVRFTFFFYWFRQLTVSSFSSFSSIVSPVVGWLIRSYAFMCWLLF